MELLIKSQIKVFGLLSCGKLYKEIASEPGISVNSVEKHLKDIYRKIGIHNRGEAGKYYVANQHARKQKGE